jgi:hypothetical protein
MKFEAQMEIEGMRIEITAQTSDTHTHSLASDRADTMTSAVTEAAQDLADILRKVLDADAS